MDGLISPILLYGACVLGALGVLLTLPRRGLSPQVIGALVAALAFGLLLVGMGVKAGRSGLPNFNFYIFAFIALGASLRVISHPRPVYAALYFILTILSSAGLYVLLSAEFMAFALVIVYAGAILITYLFVIMLATETPTADQVEALSDYDRYSREPAVATVIGFALIAALTAMISTGVGSLSTPTDPGIARNINDLPGRVDSALRSAGLIAADESVGAPEGQQSISLFPTDGTPGWVSIRYGQNQYRILSAADPKWPKDLSLSNIEGVGFSLLRDNPGSIELAGVILLMAMLGAVVLAQKKVELDEKAKLAAQDRLLGAEFTPQTSPLMAPRSQGSPSFVAGRGLGAVEVKPEGTQIAATRGGGA